VSLRGYTVPFTPEGRSSLVPPPPWHFSGDVIWISYRADPDACRAFLPDRLRLSELSVNASVSFCDWQWCSEAGDELRDPELAQFRECVVSLDCTCDGQPVARVPFAWVDATVPLVRGLLQGMPKLSGSVFLSRAYEVGRARGVRASGGRFDGTLSARGRRLIAAGVRLSGLADAPPPLATQPFVHTRHIPSWGPDIPEQCHLVRSRVTGVEFSPVWRGEAELAFGDVAGLELGALAPVEVAAGYVFSYAETLEPGGPI
jgi:enduracididine biosynthesis enzyme MppR